MGNYNPYKSKSWFIALTSGMVGSMLTLSLSTYVGNLTSNKEFQDRVVEKAEQSIQVKKASNNSSKSTPGIVEYASKAVVGVVNIKQSRGMYYNEAKVTEQGTGSGVIFKKNGDFAYIITNNHVVEEANEVEVSLYNGKKVKADIVGEDALTDLAVLKISSSNDTSVIKLGDSSILRSGEEVLAIGNPLGLDLTRTVTQGIVSATERTIPVHTSEGDWELNVLQTDAAINPGNSGGALINNKGELIGINSAKISESGIEGLGFAIPINETLPIIKEILKDGKIKRPYLGIALADIEEISPEYLNIPNNVKGGVMVTELDPDGSAYKGGLKLHDIIVSINSEQINNSSELKKLLYSKTKIGDDLTLKIYREGNLEQINVKVN